MSAAADLSRENMTAMYRRSLADLQVDYIDYYLLHAIGGGGMELFNRRFMDNGMLDFLLGERDKGRIRHLGWSFHGDIDVFDKVLGMHPTVHWDSVQIQLNYVDWRHAAAYNSDWQAAMGDDTNAEYLYGELAERGIPVVVMEPLLGGRLAGVTQDVLADMKRRRPGDSAAAWAFRFAGSLPGVLTVLSGMTYQGAPSGQPAHVLAARAAIRRGAWLPRGRGAAHGRQQEHSLHRLRILHAVPLRG